MNYRNAKYIDNEGRIDCEIEHPVYGWIPYTLDPNDTDNTIDNSELLSSMTENGDVAAYVAPSPEEELSIKRDFSVLSKRDFCINAFAAGLLSEEEAVLAAKGDWPESFTTALSSLTPSEVVAAKIEWASISVVRRNAPLLELVRASQDIPESVVDSIFGLDEA